MLENAMKTLFPYLPFKGIIFPGQTITMQALFRKVGLLPSFVWRVIAEGGVYLQDYEELIAGLSLHYNFLAILKLHRLQGVSHRQTLPLIQRLCSGATLKSIHLIFWIYQVNGSVYLKQDSPSKRTTTEEQCSHLKWTPCWGTPRTSCAFSKCSS